MAGLADINVKIGAYLKPLETGLNQAERNLRRFGSKMTDLGSQLSTTFSAAFAGIGIASVKAFGDFERLEKGLNAVTKSVVPANVQIERLKALAEAPGLGFEQAVAASTRLQAVGFSAKFAEETIKQVANAIATTGGTADNFDSVLKQFTQMIAKGRILQEDLGIIQENMPIVGTAIKEAFGTTNIEAIRASGVSAQEFVDKIVGRLGNLKRVEGGLSNSLENLGISVKTFFASIGKEINESFDLQSKIDGLGTALNNLSTWFSGLDDTVQRNIIGFGIFLAAIGPVLFIVGKLAAVAQVIVVGFKGVINLFKGVSAAFTFLLSPLGLTIAGITALAVAAIYLVKNWDAAKATFINIWIGIKNAVSTLINSILKGIDSFTSAATFGAAGTNFAKSFSFKTEDYVEVPKWKSFGETMREVGGDLLAYAGLAGKAKKETKDLNAAIFSGDQAPNVADSGSTGSSKGAARGKIKLLPIAPNAITSVASDGRQNFSISIADKYGKVIEDLTIKHSSLNAEALKLSQYVLPQADVALNSTQLKAKNYLDSLQSFNDGLTQIINSGIAEIATGFGNLLGNLASGISAKGNFANAILVPIADALENLGKLAIATGVAILGIKEAFRSLGGVGAIVAGVALVALAKFVKNKAAASAPKLAQGGLAYGPTLAIVGDNPNARSNPEVIAPLSTLKNYIDNGGGSGFPEVTIRGEDLLLAIDRTKTRKFGRVN